MTVRQPASCRDSEIESSHCPVADDAERNTVGRLGPAHHSEYQMIEGAAKPETG